MKIANYNLQLNEGWNFHLGSARKYYHAISQNGKASGALGNIGSFISGNVWQNIRVPHDWCTFLPYDPKTNAWCGYKERGEGWYYVKFKLPEDEIQNARLVFEGVLGQTTVYVNGSIVGRNFSGYNRFTCDISCYLVADQENIIVLHVDATSWEAWSYEGAGLYRPAYIEFREFARLDTDDCFVRSVDRDGNWSVLADIRVIDADNTEDDLKVISRLQAPDGTVIFEGEATAKSSISVEIPVKNAKLWSPEEPTLYKFNCELVRGDEILDEFSTSVGLRSITWDKDTGMYLNGEKYPIKGICCHQDHGGVGAAVTPEIMEYRISRLKEFGINAYRCAHHAIPDALFEVCDRLGMLVMAENRHFSVSEDGQKQLESLVRVARNHPSVFIYSMFNEEPLQGKHTGFLLTRKMREHIRKFDDTRATTGAMNGGVVETLNAADAMDVVGVNYYNNEYAAYHALKSTKALLGTENCPTFATRGIYKTDSIKKVYDCYGDYWADFTVSIAETMKSVETNEFCAGCFAWSGFDSYGEPQPHIWPSIMSHWGFMDICGFAKDTAYLLAAWYKKDLVAHLLPHWNWNEGDDVRVCVFTNADTAELFVNGRSLGEKCVDERRADWNVPFEAGVISVKVRRGDEEMVDEIRTAGAPAKLILEDVTPTSDKHEIRIINISVVDENGIFVPNFNDTVCFDGEKLTVLGVANGNPNGTQPNIARKVPVFNGHAQLITTADSTEINVSCEGLPTATI